MQSMWLSSRNVKWWSLMPMSWLSGYSSVSPSHPEMGNTHRILTIIFKVIFKCLSHSLWGTLLSCSPFGAKSKIFIRKIQKWVWLAYQQPASPDCKFLKRQALGLLSSVFPAPGQKLQVLSRHWSAPNANQGSGREILPSDSIFIFLRETFGKPRSPLFMSQTSIPVATHSTRLTLESAIEICQSLRKISLDPLHFYLFQ